MKINLKKKQFKGKVIKILKSMVHKINFTVKLMQNLHVLLPRAPQEWLL